MALRSTRYDPTRTGVMFRSFALKLRRQFRQVAKNVRELLVKDDAFGLVQNAFCPTGAGGGVDPHCSPGEAATPESVNRLASLSEDEVKSGAHPKIGYRESLGHSEVIAEWNPRERRIHVGKSYFEHGEEDRRDIIAHEIGHGMVQHLSRDPKTAAEQFFPLAESGLIGKWNEAKGRWVGIGGQRSPDEALADLAKEYLMRPEKLKKQHPRVFDVVAKITAGKKLTAADYGPTANVQNAQFSFQSDPDKLVSFQRWLRTRLDDVKGMRQKQLWEEYIEQGFHKGATRSFDDVVRTKPSPEVREALGARNQFLFSAKNSQETLDKVKLLAQRTYTDLEGVTERMGTRMGRILADGLMRGRSAKDMADDMVGAVGIEERAALRIARTELTAAHAEGQLMALRRLGVKELGVLVEWSANGDACPKCAAMAGRKFPIEKASGLIPMHPHCLCSWTPQVQRMGRVKLKSAKRLKLKRKAAKR